jgi:hypothetical protein
VLGATGLGSAATALELMQLRSNMLENAEEIGGVRTIGAVHG